MYAGFAYQVYSELITKKLLVRQRSTVCTRLIANINQPWAIEATLGEAE